MEVVIIGGGLAGLVSAILLKRQGIRVILIERNKYPFHKVCGEYISNEVKPFLMRGGLYPADIKIPQINHLKLTSINGTAATLPLDLGGFGISRYAFDHFLALRAMDEEVDILQGITVDDVTYGNDQFKLTLSDDSTIEGRIVIGAFGKRSRLDQKLKRPFMKRTSPFLGVKYHAYCEVPENEIALHNFKGGYCGISNVEEGKVNICYLSNRYNLKETGSLEVLEREIISRNPHLKKIFSEAEFITKKPIVINEISFETKGPIYQHLLMTGDAAGMITPLSGNGMSMAIHSAQLVTQVVPRYINTDNYSRKQMEQDYQSLWNKHFKKRLWKGRLIQKLFGNITGSEFAVSLAKNIKPVARYLVKQTHGKPF